MTKIGIWGMGKDTERLFKKSSILKEHIEFYVNSNSSVDSYEGLPVIFPEDIIWEESFIIVATSRYYEEIKEKLIGSGLKENYDFTNITNACIFDECICMMNQIECCSLFKEIYYKNFLSFVDCINKAMERTDDFAIQVRYNKIDGFIKCWREVSKWVYLDKENIFKEINTIIYEYILLGKNAVEILLKRAAGNDEKLLLFTDGTVFEYSQLHEFAVIFQEIILDEAYFFKTENKRPFIIDGGANIGLAVYYFKSLYPSAKIIAFEPVNELYKIIQRNIQRNNWKDVEVFQYALDGNNEKSTFFVTESSISGSLINKNLDKSVREINVMCTTLSQYIDDFVDYLKLDIEGSETKVIQEVSYKLQKIKNIFIEYHEGVDKANNSLAKILTILDANNFSYNVDKSKFYAKTRKYPLENVGKVVSELVWATNDGIK